MAMGLESRVEVLEQRHGVSDPLRRLEVEAFKVLSDRELKALDDFLAANPDRDEEKMTLEQRAAFEKLESECGRLLHEWGEDDELYGNG